MANIKCPVVPTLTVTGTGALQVQMTGSVSLANPNAIFEYDVDPVSFANYFIGVTAPADASQNHEFNLNLGWSNTLRAALDNAKADSGSLSAAADPDNRYHPFNASNDKLENFVNNWAQTKINETLLADQLSAFLTAEEIKDLTIDDISGSYANAITSLFNNLNNKDKMSAIAYQFKEDRWMEDASGDAIDPMVLPFKDGDTLTFQFNVTSNFTIDLESLSFPTGTDYSQDSSLIQPTKSSLYAVPSRIVNVVLNFVASNGAVTEAAGGDVVKTPNA